MKPCEKCGGYVVPDYTDDGNLKLLQSLCINCGRRNELACATFTVTRPDPHKSRRSAKARETETDYEPRRT